MLADPRSKHADRQLRRAVAAPAQPEELRARSGGVPRFRRQPASGDEGGDELFFDSIMREDRSVMDLLNADYTFVNERLARHYGIPEHLRQPVPAREGRQRSAPRAARPGQHPDRDLLSESHVAGRARQVGADQSARRAAAAAAAERPAARGNRGDGKVLLAARAHGAAPRRPGLRRLPQGDGSDRLRARELRRHRPLARRREARRSIRPARSSTAPKLDGVVGLRREIVDASRRSSSA